MIIVDEALRRRAATGTPIQIGLIGAGAMGRGIALQIQTAMPGMRLAVIGNRTLEHARQAYRAAGTGDVETVTDETGLARAIEVLWQVSERGDIPMHEATDIDIEYVEKVSLTADLRILALTIPAALGSQKGH